MIKKNLPRTQMIRSSERGFMEKREGKFPNAPNVTSWVRGLLFVISKILPTKIAYAHCDIPCGIYDPKPAQIAAATVLKMVQLIQDLPKGNPTINDRNKFVRCILTKEEHARKCKEEILILWTDFFKPEHLKMFPNLHDTFWKAAKLCSTNKQEVSIEHAQELIKVVDEIADIFQKTKSSSAKK